MWAMLKRLMFGGPDPEIDPAERRMKEALERNRQVNAQAQTQILDNMEHSGATMHMVETLLERMERKRDAPHP